MSFIYLASPYTHPDPKVKAERFKKVCKLAANLMHQGETIFSPIAHSHAIEIEDGRIESGAYWMKQDLPILRYAKKLIVYCLPGWLESRGVALEINFAKSLDIPVEYIGEEDYALHYRHAACGN